MSHNPDARKQASFARCRFHSTSLFGWETDRSRLFEEAGVLQQRKTPAFFVFSYNLWGPNHSPETQIPTATLAKSASLWGPIRDKYSQSLWVMKTAGLTTLGNSLSDSLGILFFS